MRMKKPDILWLYCNEINQNYSKFEIKKIQWKLRVVLKNTKMEEHSSYDKYHG